MSLWKGSQLAGRGDQTGQTFLVPPHQFWLVFSLGAGTWMTALLTGGSSKGRSSSLLGSVPQATLSAFCSLGRWRWLSDRKHDSMLGVRIPGLFSPALQACLSGPLWTSVLVKLGARVGWGGGGLHST